ncbi:MAG: right-handed parallel beta-helix repeat-containing protein [Candidatus Kerfeldbacteria bacterium]|nr:right-handed parallel beta-helix repeat-containing protein [Candidatus Kerfeldbacteria bacterium]
MNEKQVDRFLAAVVVAVFSTPAFARTIDVPGDYPLIQSAIDVAADGDTVLAAPGTYTEDNISFLGKSIVVRSEAPTDSSIVKLTTVQGTGNDSLFVFDSGEHWKSVLDGFTVINGRVGISLNNASPIIRNCRIVRNGSPGDYWSSGVRASYTALQLESCLIGWNGGMEGAGLNFFNSSPVVLNCQIVTNECTSSGAGIYAGYGHLTVTNCRISGNTGAQWGSALYMGSGILTMENCLLLDNVTTDSGALLLSSDSQGFLQNCTVAGNSGGGLYVSYSQMEVVNTILWGNGVEIMWGYGGGVGVSYSDIDGWWPGMGNIDADPLFTSARGFDYLLGVNSPAIDAGDPSIPDGISDSHPRWPAWYPNGARSDMGAYGGPNNDDWLR